MLYYCTVFSVSVSAISQQMLNTTSPSFCRQMNKQTNASSSLNNTDKQWYQPVENVEDGS